MNPLKNLPSICAGSSFTGIAGPREIPSILGAVDARGLDVDLLETRPLRVCRDIRSSSSAPATQPTQSQHALANFRKNFAAGHNVGNCKAAPRLEHAKCFAQHLVLSAERLITQLEMITSTELSGRGMCSISPFRNSTFVGARFTLVLIGQGQHLISHVETVSLACRATRRFAESRTSMPPPEPRSRTISPGFNCAKAVGLPHPSEASMASSGIWPDLGRVVEIGW